MVLQTFASLKDILSSSFEIPTFDGTIKNLRESLILKYPEAKNLLIISRFAVGSNILSDESFVKNNDAVFIIPPSSGG